VLNNFLYELLHVCVEKQWTFDVIKLVFERLTLSCATSLWLSLISGHVSFVTNDVKSAEPLLYQGLRMSSVYSSVYLAQILYSTACSYLIFYHGILLW